MEGIEKKGPRVAPDRLDKEPQLLDTVVVIPAMDEGLNVLDTIESIAVQKKSKNKELVQGAVVVINNRPNASPEIIASNMRTYTLLQGIRHGCKMSVRGKPILTNKIRKIQESGLRIEVLDAFSGEYSHPESNVGRARKIGTEHALGLVKDERSAIISTDADTILGADALRTAQYIFENEKVDVTPMELGRNVTGLDARSLKAYRTYAIYWGLNNAAHNVPKKIKALREKGMPFSLSQHSKIESSAVWLSGGGTAFTAGAYKLSGGYRPIGREEDTLLASDMVKGGAEVKDMTKKYPQLIAYTQPRISLRTERGFGHTIAHWDKPDTPFSSLPVERPEVMERILEFYKKVDVLFEKRNHKQAENLFRELCASYEMPNENIDSLWGIFSKWDGRSSREEHFRFMEASRGFFETSLPKITMYELLETAEACNAEYSKAVDEAAWSGQKITPSEVEWDWNTYSREMIKLLADTGVEMDNAQTAVKARAIFAGEYVPHYEPVVRNWMYVYVNILRKSMRSRTNLTPDQKKLAKARGLSKFTLKEYYRLHLCQLEAVKISVLQNTKRALGDEMSLEVKKKVDTMLAHLREKYDEIANAVIDDPHGYDR